MVTHPVLGILTTRIEVAAARGHNILLWCTRDPPYCLSALGSIPSRPLRLSHRLGTHRVWSDRDRHAVTLPGHVHRDRCDPGLLADDSCLGEVYPLHCGHVFVAAMPVDFVDVLNPSVNTKQDGAVDADVVGGHLDGSSLKSSPENIRHGVPRIRRVPYRHRPLDQVT